MSLPIHGSTHGLLGSDPILGFPFADYAGLSRGFGTQTIAGNSEDAVAWQEFDTSSQDVFGTDSFSGTPPPNNASGDESLLLLAQGVYIVFAAVEWQSGVVTVAADIDVSRGQSAFISQLDWALQEQLVTTAGQGATSLACYSYAVTSVGADDYGRVSLNVKNFSVSAQDITGATMAVIYIPTSRDISNVY